MLPIRFVARPSDLPEGAPALTLDGAFPSTSDAGLHLAHWPGNRTPDALRRDLSTEIVFAFLELPDGEQQELLNGSEFIALNHYDTDGICALFALTRQEEALRHRELLVDVAASGDFHAVRSEHALCIDSVLRNLKGIDKLALTQDALDVLGELLGDPKAALERAEVYLAAYRNGRADLEDALFDDLIYMDMGVWTAPLRSADAPLFDPGRHAFFADARADRALLLGRSAGGTTARFVLGTYSFFDVVSRKPSPRPDLAALCKRLNEAEGCSTDGAHCWRHQDQRGASPELWFGTEGLPLYAEHAAEHLGVSSLSPENVKAMCIDAVRATWPLPDDDDEADDDEDIFAV
jgi:hypothetical protein